MTNKRTNIMSANFFLLMLICIAGAIICLISAAKKFGGQLDFNISDTNTILSIVYLVSVLLIMIFLYAKAYPAVIFFSLVAGGVMLYNGINRFIQYNEYGELIDFVLGNSDITKGLFFSFIIFPIGIGLSYILMAISIGINTKKQGITPLSIITMVVSLISVAPITYYFVKMTIDLFKAISYLEGVSYGAENEITFIKIVYVSICLNFVFTALAIIAGCCCYKLKARTRNNYTPYSELDLSNPYAAPGASIGGNDSGNTNSAMGGQSFYQPYKGDESSNNFFTPYSTASAAENVSSEKAVESYNSSNAFVNEVSFTATKDDYVEHEFSTPDDGVNETPVSEATIQEAPIQTAPKIIIDDGARFDDVITTTESSFSVADEIQKFKNLADSGIISEVEFEEKKKQLLNN